MIIPRRALDLARARQLVQVTPDVVLDDAPRPPKAPPVFVPKPLDPTLVAEIEARYPEPVNPKRRKIQNLEVQDWKNPNSTRLGNRVTSFVPKNKVMRPAPFSRN